MHTVESYDVTADEWSNMIAGKSRHSLVVVRNKLFVFGEYTSTCEVFDNNYKMFVAIKAPIYFDTNNAFSIGNQIVIIGDDVSSILCYDIDNDKWSEETSEVTKHHRNFSSVKIPWY